MTPKWTGPTKTDPRRPSLIILGRHSTGKTWLAQELSRALGFVVIELGDTVRHEALRRGSTCLVRLAAELIEADPLYIAKAALEDPRARRTGVILVGPRTLDELDYLRREFPQTLAIGLTAPTHVRFHRWQQRSFDFDFTDTWNERELVEGQWGATELLAKSDVTITATDVVLQRCVALVRDFGVEVLAHVS